MNKWIGSGKVSGDPIIKYDGDKASFIAFTIMVKRNRRIKEGDQPVDFIDCICTGHNARIVEKYLYKGKKVEVCGPLQSGHYTDKEGRKNIHKDSICRGNQLRGNKSGRGRTPGEGTPGPGAGTGAA